MPLDRRASAKAVNSYNMSFYGADIRTETFSRVKKYNEEQRLARIMDDKIRTIGVEKDALTEQVTTKRNNEVRPLV